MNYSQFHEQIKEAIRIREEGRLLESRPLFEKLVNKLKTRISQKSSAELKYIYATAMGEYIIQYRLEAGAVYREALKLGKDLLKYDNDNKINNPLSIRSVSNTLLNLGAYEEAEPLLREIIPLYENNSSRQGDTKAHLAYCLFRSGKVEQAAYLIENAIPLIQENSAKEDELAVWHSHALIVKSLILNALNNKKEAIQAVSLALDIAEKGKKPIRITQAKHVLAFLQK